MKPEDIKIEKGISDVQNILKHIKNEEKKFKKEQWLRENYNKSIRRRKDKND